MRRGELRESRTPGELRNYDGADSRTTLGSRVIELLLSNLGRALSRQINPDSLIDYDTAADTQHASATGFVPANICCLNSASLGLIWRQVARVQGMRVGNSELDSRPSLNSAHSVLLGMHRGKLQEWRPSAT